MYEHIIQTVIETPWAILPEKLVVIGQLLALRASGVRLTAEEVKERISAARPGERQTFSGGGAVAVIPVVGTIVPRGNMFIESSGAVSVQRLTSAFRAAVADPDISGIVLDVDSPGGQVGGVAELAREIYQARGQKPVKAVANGLAASAAYWLASAADELIVTPSGDVGSIGVFAVHQDFSQALEREGVKVNLISAGKYKVEGNPYEPLSDEARAAMQSRVDGVYQMFTGDVARFRGVTRQAVVNGFGEGRVVGAEQAVELGMADRVATIDEVISGMVSRGNSGGRGNRAEADMDYRLRRLRANSR